MYDYRYPICYENEQEQREAVAMGVKKEIAHIPDRVLFCYRGDDYPLLGTSFSETQSFPTGRIIVSKPWRAVKLIVQGKLMSKYIEDLREIQAKYKGSNIREVMEDFLATQGIDKDNRASIIADYFISESMDRAGAKAEEPKVSPTELNLRELDSIYKEVASIKYKAAKITSELAPGSLLILLMDARRNRDLGKATLQLAKFAADLPR